MQYVRQVCGFDPKVCCLSAQVIIKLYALFLSGKIRKSQNFWSGFKESQKKLFQCFRSEFRRKSHFEKKKVTKSTPKNRNFLKLFSKFV
jgi:hypothetical protein